MKSKSLLTLFLIFNTSCVFCQKRNFSSDIRFLNYLFSTRDYKGASEWINFKLENSPLSRNQTDTLNYYLGKSYYFQKDFTPATTYFNKVSKSSGLHVESTFYCALNLSYMEEYDMAEQKLRKLTLNDSMLFELKKLQLAGLSLLKRDTALYRSFSTYFTQKHHALSKQEINLDLHYNNMKKFKKKSKFLAGFMSAAVPGMGKLYTKRPGEALATFFKTGLIGLPALEAYVKRGSSDARFIIFGSLFSALYIANIWGSVLSVNVYRTELNSTLDEKILLDLHIPLRSIFN
ncbi:hypothetical protein FNH22_17685 [Fulvivirga sp. M361]|uniref:tetratricopeptide repeat protein n=1 Tax=Fulvivirga sp. M361 TaxID=2594266 RepID=UPI00117BCC01|nr:hypothetical protein [Fulvivirga sp. M361]TRX55993.1 hypothetical protein FNH22_17685 [Fulvivirga sp. M361]